MGSYGVDVLSPQVTPRRIWVLANRLPPAARRPGEDWSTEAELLAHLADQLAALTWVTLRAAGAKGAARPRPLPRPRRHPAALPAGPGPAALASPDQPPGPAKADTWAAAARQLAAMPGVVVSDG